jgi:PAS domain S-box-containing protein
MMVPDEADETEDSLLRSVALQNAQSILAARQRAEEELLRTREALRESQERLEAALTAAGTGTFRWDIQTNTVEWDGNLDRLFGLGSQVRTQSLKDFTSAVHKDDCPQVMEAFERSAADGSAVDLEFRVIWRDGTIHWIQMKAQAFGPTGGASVYMTGACADVTARKRTETALRDETRILELLNDTGRMLASSLDLRALLQAVTDAATELSGAQFGAFFYNTTGETGDSYLLYTLSGVPEESFAGFAMPRATAMFGATFRGEAPIRCADVRRDPRYGQMAPHYGMPKGHLPVCSYLAVPVRSRSGTVIGGLFFGHEEPGVFTDRAERLVVGIASQAGVAIDNARMYEAAQQAAEERKSLLESERAARTAAERLSDIKDEFLATLSHELRTPLNAILGWTHVLRSGRGPEDLAKGLDTIERNARVQTQLIEDLLDMSRITSGKLRLDIQPLRPANFVEAAVDTLRPAANAKGIKLQTALDPVAGPIAGDPGRLQQVISNLLSNAIKFTPKGGRVQVLLSRVNSHIEITVADTGVGIRPDLIAHLFERFRQADTSTTRNHGGLGLGLSIVKSLVELHGGTISLTSAGEGQGTTAAVQLPLLVAQEDTRAGDRLHPGGAGRAVPVIPGELAGVSVLVVDDSADARDLVRRILEDCAAEVTTAANANEALEIIARNPPDVLVSDVGMPEEDGYELLARVRALPPDRGGRVPAIALTAFARSEDRTRALRAGFVVHVAKPVDPAELIATVASVARRFPNS